MGEGRGRREGSITATQWDPPKTHPRSRGETLVNVDLEPLQRISDQGVQLAPRLHIDHLTLDYSAAQFAPARSSDPLLDGVALKHAAHWRAEAQVAIALKQMEAAALSQIDIAASRGQMSCRIAWRDLSKTILQAEQFDRLAKKLRERGFQIELIEAATAFRVSW